MLISDPENIQQHKTHHDIKQKVKQLMICQLVEINNSAQIKTKICHTQQCMINDNILIALLQYHIKHHTKHK